MRLEILNNQKKYKTRQLKKSIKIAIEQAIKNEDVYNVLQKKNIVLVISLVLTNNNQIRSLNREYRNIDKVTDVLSFPLIENEDYILNEISDKDIYINKNNQKEVNLGDIIISLERAYEQSIEVGNSFEKEVMFLAVHSTLHLLGYDHISSDDESKMIAQQKQIMNKLAKY